MSKLELRQTGSGMDNNNTHKIFHDHGGRRIPTALLIITHSPRILAYPYETSFYTDIFSTISQSFSQFGRRHQYYYYQFCRQHHRRGCIYINITIYNSNSTNSSISLLQCGSIRSKECGLIAALTWEVFLQSPR